MNRIVVKSSNVNTRAINRKDGTSVVFREQRAALEQGQDFPKPFTINLGQDQPPYPAGDYLLDVSSLEVGDFDALRVGRRVVLVPVPAGKA